VPVIFISQEPAELILTEGMPNYGLISGTKLLYVANTENDLFLHSSDGHYSSYGCAARYYGPHGGAGGWSGYDPKSGTYCRGGYAKGPYGSAYARGPQSLHKSSVPGKDEQGDHAEKPSHQERWRTRTKVMGLGPGEKR
jgi:hypothetical protein